MRNRAEPFALRKGKSFAGIGSTTAYAASGEKADVYMVDFPRDGDANYDGVWAVSYTHLMLILIHSQSLISEPLRLKSA